MIDVTVKIVVGVDGPYLVVNILAENEGWAQGGDDIDEDTIVEASGSS